MGNANPAKSSKKKGKAKMVDDTRHTFDDQRESWLRQWGPAFQQSTNTGAFYKRIGQSLVDEFGYALKGPIEKPVDLSLVPESERRAESDRRSEFMKALSKTLGNWFRYHYKDKPVESLEDRLLKNMIELAVERPKRPRATQEYSKKFWVERIRPAFEVSRGDAVLTDAERIRKIVEATDACWNAESSEFRDAFEREVLEQYQADVAAYERRFLPCRGDAVQLADSWERYDSMVMAFADALGKMIGGVVVVDAVVPSGSLGGRFQFKSVQSALLPDSDGYLGTKMLMDEWDEAAGKARQERFLSYAETLFSDEERRRRIVTRDDILDYQQRQEADRKVETSEPGSSWSEMSSTQTTTTATAAAFVSPPTHSIPVVPSPILPPCIPVVPNHILPPCSPGGSLQTPETALTSPSILGLDLSQAISMPGEDVNLLSVTSLEPKWEQQTDWTFIDPNPSPILASRVASPPPSWTSLAQQDLDQWYEPPVSELDCSSHSDLMYAMVGIKRNQDGLLVWTDTGLPFTPMNSPVLEPPLPNATTVSPRDLMLPPGPTPMTSVTQPPPSGNPPLSFSPTSQPLLPLGPSGEMNTGSPADLMIPPTSTPTLSSGAHPPTSTHPHLSSSSTSIPVPSAPQPSSANTPTSLSVAQQLTIDNQQRELVGLAGLTQATSSISAPPPNSAPPPHSAPRPPLPDSQNPSAPGLGIGNVHPMPSTAASIPSPFARPFSAATNPVPEGTSGSIPSPFAKSFLPPKKLASEEGIDSTTAPIPSPFAKSFLPPKKSVPEGTIASTAADQAVTQIESHGNGTVGGKNDKGSMNLGEGGKGEVKSAAEKPKRARKRKLSEEVPEPLEKRVRIPPKRWGVEEEAATRQTPTTTKKKAQGKR